MELYFRGFKFCLLCWIFAYVSTWFWLFWVHSRQLKIVAHGTTFQVSLYRWFWFLWLWLRVWSNKRGIPAQNALTSIWLKTTLLHFQVFKSKDKEIWFWQHCSQFIFLLLCTVLPLPTEDWIGLVSARRYGLCSLRNTFTMWLYSSLFGSSSFHKIIMCSSILRQLSHPSKILELTWA